MNNSDLTIAKSFGINLRELRLEQNLKQKQIADKLIVSESTYANWEQGRREPSLYYLLRLASVLQTDMNTLFDFETPD